MGEKLDTGIRREQIAHAALAVISQHGLKRLNVAAVARKIGLVPSAIYRHFDSKDAVLDSVLELVRERLLANVEAARDATPDALERLRVLLVRHIDLIRHNQGIPRIVFSEEFYAGRRDRRARLFAMIETYLNKVASIVSEGQRDGTIRPDVSPAAVAVMFLGLVQPAGVLWHISGGKFDVAEHTTRAWGIFRQAIEAP